MSGTLPTIIGPGGLQPQTPASLNSQLIANATVLSPRLTVLPAGLIDDIAGTDTGALVVIDQARVDTVDSLTPYAANAWLLLQQGNLVGVPQGVASNTSVYVVFTSNNAPNFPIPAGFIVSDGTYQYVVQDGGIIGTGNISLPLQAVATVAGSWAVPANTVTQLVTSIPSSVNLTVTNPLAGTAGGTAQTEAQYRAAVTQAYTASAQGMASFLKTLLANVPGVQARLISVQPQTGGGWKVLCGGSGDPAQIGNAIWSALFDISTLVGSELLVAGITNANPGVVTTTLNHGYASGQVINISGVVGLSGVNNTALTITVITETTFSIGINTTSSGAYVSGGIVTPNFRNVTTSIDNYPDTYSIIFVAPPAQTVTMTVTWNTPLSGVSTAGVAQAGQTALAAYINSIYVGQPINLFLLQETFQLAVANIIPAYQLTRMVFAVSINGIGVSPSSGTGIIAGDPESYFTCLATGINITQG